VAGTLVTRAYCCHCWLFDRFTDIYWSVVSIGRDYFFFKIHYCSNGWGQ